jgi:hypothetical protein
MESDRRILWHYTTGLNFTGIAKSGVLRPATLHVPDGESPAVWFTASPRWEETANKAVARGPGKMPRTLSREETERVANGLYRIGVAPETAPHPWHEYQRISGARSRMIKALERIAMRDGSNPREDWFVSFRPVARRLWIAVEQWDGSAWQPVGDSDEVERLSTCA